MKMYDVEFHRTEEQMVMASRSGKQNILEGMNDYATSVNSGLHLLNVARGSFVELQEDYEDYLLRNNLQLWDKNDFRVLKIRELGKTRVKDINYFLNIMRTRPAETNANLILTLIYQATFLCDRLLGKMERDFIENGGFKEKMYRIRKNHRDTNR